MRRRLYYPGEPSPENVAHNLDFSTAEVRRLAESAPQRDVREADFGAEYHGFTGFERAGKGSTLKRRS